MQTLTPLPDGAAIKITTAHYLTPNRRDINLRGIDPDVRVDENRDARFGDVDQGRAVARRDRAAAEEDRAAKTLAGYRRVSCGRRRTSRTTVPLRANETSSIRRRIKKMPKPRPRSSGSTFDRSDGSANPIPRSWTSIESSIPSKVQATVIFRPGFRCRARPRCSALRRPRAEYRRSRRRKSRTRPQIRRCRGAPARRFGCRSCRRHSTVFQGRLFS